MLYNFKSTFIIFLCFSQQPCEIDKADTFGNAEPWSKLKVAELELEAVFTLVNTNPYSKHHVLSDLHSPPTVWTWPFYALSSPEATYRHTCNSIVYLFIYGLAFPYQIVSILR